jgi:hypothetical protein
VEWTDALAPPNVSTNGVSEMLLSDDGTVQQVKALVLRTVAGSGFVRLKVTGAAVIENRAG